MGSELPFAKAGKKSHATFAQALAPSEPDPLADVTYTGDLEADSRVELDALQQGFRERRKREDDRFRDATDSEYWVAVCFKNRREKEAFLSAVAAGIPLAGDKYINGRELAQRLGIELEV